MTTLDILLQLKKLFANKKRWTKHCLARDEDGHAACLDGKPTKLAVCYCLSGGMCKIASRSLAWRRGVMLLRDAINDLYSTRLPNQPVLRRGDAVRQCQLFNDHWRTTIYHVRRVVDRAIFLERKHLKEKQARAKDN